MTVTTPSLPYTFRLYGKDLGLPWLDTLFVCDYHSAKVGYWHSHDQLEVICRLKGELRYDFRGLPPLTIHQGQALVIPVGTDHRLSDTVDAPGLRICLLVSNKTNRLPPKAIINPIVGRKLHRLLNARAITPFPIPPILQSRLYQIVELAASPALRTDSLRRAHLQTLVTDALLTLTTVPVRPHNPSSQIVERAKEYLESRLAEKIRIRELLDYVGYGQSQFFHLFRRDTGTTPNEWVARRRIDLACELLCNTTNEIRTIAVCVGWPDAAYFCRVFKHQTGQTPSAYRNAHRTSAKTSS